MTISIDGFSFIEVYTFVDGRSSSMGSFDFNGRIHQKLVESVSNSCLQLK